MKTNTPNAYIKIAPFVTGLLGGLFIIYNLVLLQNPKYHEVSTYFIAGGIFIGTGIMMAVSRDIGSRMYAILAWLVTIFFAYTALLFVAAMANPFFFVPLLLNPGRLVTYGLQVTFFVALVIYMHTVRVRLKRSAGSVHPPSVSELPKVPWYKRTWLQIVAFIVVPPLGIITMWLFMPWRRGVKILLTLLLLFHSAAFLSTITTLTGGSSTQLRAEETKMESFLEQKYSKRFDVKNGKIARGGDAMFGVRFSTYKADVSPLDDPSVTFTASRIVSGRSLDGSADDPDRINYTDTYLSTLWTREIREQVEGAVRKEQPGIFEFSLRISTPPPRALRTEFNDTIWGTVPKHSDLTAAQKKMLSYMADIMSQGTVDSNNILAHATAILAFRQAVDPDNIKPNISVSYKVFKDKADRTHRWEYAKLSWGIKFSDVTSADQLAPWFQERDEDAIKYYNPETKKFDLSHPKA